MILYYNFDYTDYSKKKTNNLIFMTKFRQFIYVNDNDFDYQYSRLVYGNF